MNAPQRIGLTAKQRETFDYVSANPDASYREIMTALGLRSTCQVFDRLRGLEQRGYIRRRYSRARSIEIITTPAKPSLCEVNGQPFLFIPKTRAA